MADESPKQVGGFTVMAGGKTMRFGALGHDYLGHGAEGLRLVKVLGPGLGVDYEEEAYKALADDVNVLYFEATQSGSGGSTILTAHTVQSASFGVLIGGSPLQTQATETAREMDPEQKQVERLRKRPLHEKVALLRHLGEVLQRLHSDDRTVPYLSPWSAHLLEGDALKISDVGLGVQPDQDQFDPETIPAEILACWAPEVRAAIHARAAVQVGPAADVYAFAATAEAVLRGKPLKLQEPQEGEPGQPPLALAPHQDFSRELQRALRQGLDPNVDRRATLPTLIAALKEHENAETLKYVPPSPWPKVAGAAAGVLVVLALVLGVIVPALQGPPDLIKAKQTYAEATRTEDLEARLELLNQATVTEDGAATLLPEAARLRAITRYLRWQDNRQAEGGAGDPEVLIGVLEALEQDAITGDDDVSHALRLVAGLLWRWELGGEYRERGDGLLEQVGGDLAPLARAAANLTAAGAVNLAPAELDGWEEAGRATLRDTSPLVRAFAPPAGYDDPETFPEPPVGVRLESLWVAQLILGRIQTSRGAFEDARAKLESAREQVPCFATLAATGLMLLEGGGTDEARTRGVEFLDAAEQRRAFAEARLAKARRGLQQAHAVAPPAADPYAKAAAAFAQAAGVPTEAPGRDVAAAVKAGVAEARFYEAATLAAEPGAEVAALTKLEAAQGALGEAPQVADRFQPDLEAARGLVLLRQGGGEAALEALREWFAGGDPARGWAELPELTPPPATRAKRTEVAQALYRGALARLDGLVGAEEVTREALSDAEDLLEEIDALRGLPEAQGAIDVVGGLLAKVRVELGRAGLSPRNAERALEAARQAAQSALEQISAEDDPARWLQALGRRLEVFRTQARLGEGLEESLPPLREALELMRSTEESLPRTLRREWEAFAERELGSLRARYRAELEGFVAERRDAWLGISAQDSGYDERRAEEESAILEEAVGLYGDEIPEEAEYFVGQLHHYLARLHWSRQLVPKVFEAAELALDLLDRIDPEREPRAAEAAKRVNTLQGYVALARGEGVLRRPREFAYDALARAIGARDFAELKRSPERFILGSAQLEPAQVLAADVVARYTASPEGGQPPIPSDPTWNQPLQDASTMLEDLRFATAIDARNPRGFLLLARVEFSQGDAASAQHALEALRLARGNDDLVQVTTHAARLHCYAMAKTGGGEAIASEAFRAVAEEGREAAQELFRRDASKQQISVNHGPSYWYARSLYEAGLALFRDQQRKDQAQGPLSEAQRAWEDFEEEVEGYDLPSEAAQWNLQKANTINMLSDLRND